MIFDGENMFFRKKELTSGGITSDVLDVGPGEASNPLTLVLDVSKDAGEGAMTTTLKTSDTPTFTTSFTLATYTGVPVKAKLPRGNKGYLRLDVTSGKTDGTMTAGLVMDDDIPWKD